MRAPPLGRASGAVVICWVLATASAAAQTNLPHAHIGHVTDAFDAAPTGPGLLPLAMAEAEVAVGHVELASLETGSLAAIKMHVAHALHAIDPTLVLDGPGYGYGLRQAAAETVRHIELAGSEPGASVNVRTHAPHVATTAGNAVRRADAMVALAQQLLTTNSINDATALLQRLSAESQALLFGRDVDGDGRVGWEVGEGGLRQSSQHMTLMKRGEGLTN